MEPRQNKLEQWRNKTESEKHTLAMTGSIVLTSLVVLVWGYTFINTLGTEQEMAKTEEYGEQFSPLAPIKNLFSENLAKIKEGATAAKNSASAIISGATAVPDDGQIETQ